MLIDVRDSTIRANVERPSGRERLIRVDHPVGARDRLRRIAEEGIVHAERLRESPVCFRGIDADREVGNVERADLIPTLTE
jgi:hypothetical protein